MTPARAEARRTGSLDPRLFILVDEAAKIAPVRNLAPWLSRCGDHGIAIATIWRLIAQTRQSLSIGHQKAGPSPSLRQIGRGQRAYGIQSRASTCDEPPASTRKPVLSSVCTWQVCVSSKVS